MCKQFSITICVFFLKIGYLKIVYHKVPYVFFPLCFRALQAHVLTLDRPRWMVFTVSIIVS